RHVLAVSRELVSVREYVGHFTLDPAQGRDRIKAAAFSSLTEEDDVTAVGRPCRMRVSRRMRRQPERLSGADQVDIDVRVVSLPAVPDKGDLVAVRRKSGLRFPARKTGERDYVQKWSWNFAGRAKKHRPDCDSER